MSQRQDLGYHIRIMSNLLKRRVLTLESTMEGDSSTAMQGRIMGYLHQHRQEEIFQRDLEEAFQIRRSTASRILTRMEEQGLIRRESVVRDARLRKLVLTEKAEELRSAVAERIRAMEGILAAGLTSAEVEQFLTIAGKIEHNLSQIPVPKEEAKCSKN